MAVVQSSLNQPKSVKKTHQNIFKNIQQTIIILYLKVLKNEHTPRKKKQTGSPMT